MHSLLVLLIGMRDWIGLASGAFGLIASVLWFWAAGTAPPPKEAAYFGGKEDPNSPFKTIWRRAAQRN